MHFTKMYLISYGVAELLWVTTTSYVNTYDDGYYVEEVLHDRCMYFLSYMEVDSTRVTIMKSTFM